MDERSEAASPRSGRGFEALGNLGEVGGEKCPLVMASKFSNALKPSLPISPHDHPQFTIAVHLACSPTRIVLNRSTSNSFSLFAN